MKRRPPRRVRDLRAYALGTQLRLIFGGLLIVVIVGNGLIWMIYGSGAVRAALLCTAIGLAPGLLIVGLLLAMEWYVRRSRDE
jgi:hypothetical protein